MLHSSSARLARSVHVQYRLATLQCFEQTRRIATQWQARNRLRSDSHSDDAELTGVGGINRGWASHHGRSVHYCQARPQVQQQARL
jgi:hypothetical protein